MTEHTGGVRRREFLKVLGAAGATTAVVGCGSGDVERLIPYVVQPDQTVPGVSTYYASTCRECAVGCGVIAETRDGRAIKLEGNPAHPLSRGAICAHGQAALQGLYNPDRYRQPMVRRSKGGKLEQVTWAEAMQLFLSELGKARTAGAANVVFLNKHESGSFPSVLDSWLAGMGMPPHLSVDATADAAVAAANQAAYGAAWPRLNFGDARLIVSIGADFLDTWGGSVPQQLDFADARAKLEGAPRFVYIGARRSLTGLNADTWIPARPGSELAIATALAGAVGGGGGGTSLDQAAQQAGVEPAVLQRLAQELSTSKPSLVLSGVTTNSAFDVATAVTRLNTALGNVGTTIRPAEGIAGFDGMASPMAVMAAVERMRAGQVPMAMLRGVNPAFTFPKSANVADAIRKVPFVVSFSSYPDETAELADLVLPDHHPLEAWGDAQATPNTISLQQPAMDPVFNTRQTADVLLHAQALATSPAAKFDSGAYRTWLIGRHGGTTAFTSALTTAVAPGSIPRPAAPPAAPAPAAPAPAIETTQGDYFFVVYPSPTLGDGSGANKPWLQELPDPVSKICWQTWIELHPSTAQKLDVDPGELVTVTGPNNLSVTAPVYPYLGVRPDTVAMPFGNGHTAYGRYATGTGVNPLDAIAAGFDPKSGAFAWTATKVRVAKADGYHQLVTTEGSARQHGRGIAQALTVTELGTLPAQGAERATQIAPTGSPGSAHSRPGEAGASGGNAPTEAGQGGQPPKGEHEGTTGEHGAGGEHEFPGDASHDFLPGLRAPVAQDAQGDYPSDDNKRGMYDPAKWDMSKRRWAMTIDLARCTGCSACVTACYAENNIPTVGAAYQARNTMDGAVPYNKPGANIYRSREMSWIRLERYFEGGDDPATFDPTFEARVVPMLCQHCGNAPCEPVCPVYATYHSPDGLNVQVYNRCVGTRYCSNNCPYKVRYFNWFGYGEPNRPQYAWPEPLNWQLNPDVNVRGKGVMEKCTFCVQRIREAENRAKLENRPLQPDEFTVACAQACPSRAITFGDAADENWSVARLAYDRRAYHVFEELNTFTAVVYLKKVNHPGAGEPTRAAPGPVPESSGPPATSRPPGGH